MLFALNKNIRVTAFIACSSLASLFVTNAIASEKIMHMHVQLDKYSQPVASIEINGKKQNFLLDTGSSDALHLCDFSPPYRAMLLISLAVAR
ncbi:hypothetical protein [Xenorhabdus innexi]|uniref:Uncharacterized protein n=1 Tax=Xenorhabdus innexi TaxID=290109 RepID=A0A2G0N6L4_9GAMM|nr:hypothetical protein [Xenorhabdus innexi]PHM30338.1 hypothetical protein Xinn_03312 [Xenorhabdus innexi]